MAMLALFGFASIASCLFIWVHNNTTQSPSISFQNPCAPSSSFLLFFSPTIYHSRKPLLHFSFLVILANKQKPTKTKKKSPNHLTVTSKGCAQYSSCELGFCFNANLIGSDDVIGVT